MKNPILNVGTNTKTVKGDKLGYSTAIAYLAPSDESGYNTCPNASKGCRKACLFTAGMGNFSNVKKARIYKTVSFFENTDLWMKRLIFDINKLVKDSTKGGTTPCIRINGTSDIAWEDQLVDGKNVMDMFPNIQFYDYSKSEKRMMKFLTGDFPKNYHLTFSKSESNDESVMRVLKAGGNVAVVFKNLPDTYLGYPVIDGDETDLRFLDSSNVIVGLTAKGKARTDTSGFVVSP